MSELDNKLGIIGDNLDLVREFCIKTISAGLAKQTDADDLLNIGVIGLIKAINENKDYEQGIVNEIIMYLRCRK